MDIQKEEEEFEILKGLSLKEKIDKINSFESENDKLRAMRVIDSQFARKQILCKMQLKTDEQRLAALELIQDHFFKFKIISEIEDEEQKVRALKLPLMDDLKIKIIRKLSDRIKLYLLPYILSPKKQSELIGFIQDDKIKIQMLAYLGSENLQTKVLMSVKDDDVKIHQLESMEFSQLKNQILLISSIKDERKRSEQMDKYVSDDRGKNIINMTIKDRELLKQIFLPRNRKYKRIGLDPNMTIGIEVETEGEYSFIVEEIQSVLDRENGRKWKTKDDFSLNSGVEIVSPILTDNEEDVEDVYMVCEMMKKTGQNITNRCGAHIHIGADYLKSKEAYINLYEIWGNTERIIYIMSNREGSTPRSKIRDFSQTISEKVSKALKNGTIQLYSEESLSEFIDDMKRVQDDRYVGLNIFNINNKNNTVEFRVANGTIDPDTWIENAKLFGRIVQVSEQLAEIQEKDELSKEEKELICLKELLKDDIPQVEKAEILTRILFTEDERKIYLRRYMVNNELMKELPIRDDPFNMSVFRSVDFKEEKDEELDDDSMR